MEDIKKRYKSIKNREYNYLLCLFIYENIESKDIRKDLENKFYKFKPSEELIDEYNILLQNRRIKKDSDNYNKINKIFKQLGVKKNEVGIKFFKSLNSDNTKSYDKSFLKYEDFENLYLQEKEKICCGYCGISEKQIEYLIERNDIKTKRLATRGRTLEIDRIRPHSGYKKENIILSCYWCNNAKTDEFSLQEFELIAKGINNSFSERLNDSISFPDYKKYILP